MRDNPVKTKLQAGGNSFGFFAWEFFTPGLAQIVKEAGAEFVLFDMEHSGAGVDVMKQQISFCRGLGLAPFVRVPTNQYHFVARLLDLGALGIMVPMVETAQQAKEIVKWSSYPPKGRRGAAFGAAHDDYSGGSVRDKISAAEARRFLMIQIETEVGLENVEEIAAVPGVDCLWIGHFDLSNFLGVPAEFDNPKYVKAVDRVVAAAKKNGNVLGISSATDEWAREYYSKGFRIVSFGPDTVMLQTNLAARLSAMRNFSDSAPVKDTRKKAKI